MFVYVLILFVAETRMFWVKTMAGGTLSPAVARASAAKELIDLVI